nr:MAG TPA: hypothetical protein [Caudoviricetes sp.]
MFPVSTYIIHDEIYRVNNFLKFFLENLTL